MEHRMRIKGKEVEMKSWKFLKKEKQKNLAVARGWNY